MNKAEIYNKQFYELQSDGSYKSAREVVPLIIKMYGPKLIIDIGGGVGTWCKAFEESGVKAVCVDGEHVAETRCKNKITADLETADLTKLNLPGSDLLLCLEVAEHLPEERAKSFINELCQLAPVIVFSAAIPGQGGTNHVNEQPHEYWHGFFEANGFKREDVLRLAVAGCDNVEWWYKQNIFTYKKL